MIVEIPLWCVITLKLVSEEFAPSHSFGDALLHSVTVGDMWGDGHQYSHKSQPPPLLHSVSQMESVLCHHSGRETDTDVTSTDIRAFYFIFFKAMGVGRAQRRRCVCFFVIRKWTFNKPTSVWSPSVFLSPAWLPHSASGRSANVGIMLHVTVRQICAGEGVHTTGL